MDKYLQQCKFHYEKLQNHLVNLIENSEKCNKNKTISSMMVRIYLLTQKEMDRYKIKKYLKKSYPYFEKINQRDFNFIKENMHLFDLVPAEYVDEILGYLEDPEVVKNLLQEVWDDLIGLSKSCICYAHHARVPVDGKYTVSFVPKIRISQATKDLEIKSLD